MNDQENLICLNKNFSTTQNVSQLKPVIENQPNDKFETFLFLPENSDRKGEGGLRTQGYFKKKLPEQPLVTIITVVFNGEIYLEEAILSVLTQTYPNIEYIIIDGASTDHTVEIIEKYYYSIDYWVSEKDKGIYDAMNKGITLATGEIIGIINSDDYYESFAVKKIVNAYNKISNRNNDLIILSGAILKVDEIKSTQFVNKRNYNYLLQKIDWGMPLNHPATFMTKTTYKFFDKFSTRFKICGDYDLIYRIYYSPIKTQFIFIDDVIATMRLNGISNQIKSIIDDSEDVKVVS